MSLVSVVCCPVEVSATSWSVVQRSPTECGVSKKCEREASKKMRRPRPPRGCRAIGKKIKYEISNFTRIQISWSLMVVSCKLPLCCQKPTFADNAGRNNIWVVQASCVYAELRTYCICTKLFISHTRILLFFLGIVVTRVCTFVMSVRSSVCVYQRGSC
jgi:hypothetical protein